VRKPLHIGRLQPAVRSGSAGQDERLRLISGHARGVELGGDGLLDRRAVEDRNYHCGPLAICLQVGLRGPQRVRERLKDTEGPLGRMRRLKRVAGIGIAALHPH
jgi:hypothetical protein